MLRYFAAILPPEETANQIMSVLKDGFGDLTQTTTSPNVKVMYKDGMDPYEDWEQVVQTTAASAVPFKVKLGKPEMIGDYLFGMPIQSDALNQLHAASVKKMFELQQQKHSNPALDKSEAFFESQSIFVPHLTLATGMFSDGFMANLALRKISQALSNLPEFTVSELVLYEALIYSHVYEATGKIALGKPNAVLEPALGLVPVTV